MREALVCAALLQSSAAFERAASLHFQPNSMPISALCSQIIGTVVLIPNQDRAFQ